MEVVVFVISALALVTRWWGQRTNVDDVEGHCGGGAQGRWEHWGLGVQGLLVRHLLCLWLLFERLGSGVWGCGSCTDAQLGGQRWPIIEGFI